MSAFLILPTRSGLSYRGKRPTFPRSISAGATGLHVELFNGLRLWAAPGALRELPKLDSDFAEIAAAAVPMTAEQYAELCRVAEIRRAYNPATDNGAEYESRVRAMAAAIPAMPDREAAAPSEGEGPLVESVRVENLPGGLFSVTAEAGAGKVPDAARIESSYAEAERQARNMAARYGVDVYDSTREGREALEQKHSAERAARAERETIRRNRRAQAEGMAEIARAEQRAAIAETVETINLAPTWAGILPALRALIENSNPEGRRTAWAELERMAALADERNRMAGRIEAAAELARGTLGGFDPASNGRAAVAAILAALETVSGEAR